MVPKDRVVLCPLTCISHARLHTSPHFLASIILAIHFSSSTCQKPRLWKQDPSSKKDLLLALPTQALKTCEQS